MLSVIRRDNLISWDLAWVLPDSGRIRNGEILGLDHSWRLRIVPHTCPHFYLRRR